MMKRRWRVSRHSGLWPRLVGMLVTATGVLELAAAAEFRTFTDKQGRKIEAELLAVEGDSVTLKLKNGKEYTLPIGNFANEEQTYLRSQGKTPPSDAADVAGAEGGGADLDPGKINAIIGHSLFGEEALWASDPDAVAKRLKWPEESRTPRQSSYRKYPKNDYRFLGTRPYSAALYGAEGKVVSLSLVFANKGDLFGAAGGAEAHFDKGEPIPDDASKVLEKAMENDEKRIVTALSSVLGEPTTQRYGEGKSRTRVDRWDWEGHAFLLTSLDGEYIGLQIEPSGVADEGGKSARVPDAAVRERVRANVERRDNGDVVIRNIPMVDQGPKGYCVPATFERCMRYLDVPADMYLLAMAGESGIGGGTSVSRLISAIGRDVKRKGRRLDEIGANYLSVSRLAKYIDNGVPVIWSMCSTRWFNETANARTKERTGVTDWSDWKTRMKEAEKIAKRRDQADSNYHVVIIIGYNKETGELAFSDSWGPRYAERWITVAEGKTVSNDQLYVIGL